MNFRRARLVILAAAVGIFLINAAAAPKVHIEDRIIVHAIGVDKVSGGFEISLQVFSTDGSGQNTPIDPTKPNMKLISAKGKTIYEGVKNCELLLGGEAFIGHNKLILFGGSLFDEDLSKMLDWFMRENESYLGVAVAYSDKSAKEVLAAPLTEGAVAVENIEDTIEYAAKSGFTARCDLLTLKNDLADGGGALPVITLISKQEGEKEQKAQIEIEKTALLKGGKVVGFLNTTEAAGLLWLRGEMQSCTAAVSGGGEFNVQIKARRISRRVIQDGGNIVLKVGIKLSAEPVEDVGSKEALEAKSLAKEAVLSACEQCCEVVLQECGANTLRLSQALKADLPQFYANLNLEKGELDEVIKNLWVEVEIE